MASHDVAQLLVRIAEGDKAALDEMTPLVYDELRRLAQRLLAVERPDHTLQPTALVHEAYLKLIDVTSVEWRHRAHFFAVSSQLMRRILLDRARRRTAAKRGGKSPRINLDEIPDVSSAVDYGRPLRAKGWEGPMRQGFVLMPRARASENSSKIFVAESANSVSARNSGTMKW